MNAQQLKEKAITDHNVTTILPSGLVDINKTNLAAAIADLADQASAAISKEMTAHSESIAKKSATIDEAMAVMNQAIRNIEVAHHNYDEIIKDVRLFRMAITSEVAQVESAVQRLKKLDLKAVANDLNMIGMALSNPQIRMLLKGTDEQTG